MLTQGVHHMKLYSFKTIISAVVLSAFGFISLPTVSAVVLGAGATVAMSDVVSAKGIKDVGVKSCNGCGMTGRKKNSRSGAVRSPPGTVRR